MKKTLLALSVGSVLSFSAHAEVVMTEYVEGGANNKAIELFNNSEQAITLDGYHLARFKDGSETASSMVKLDGVTMAAGEVIVVRNNATDTPLAESLQVITASSLVHNGGDAVALLSGEQVMDIVGAVPTPKNWAKDKTLRRKSTTANPVYNESEWEVLAKNTNDGLGSVSGVTPPNPDPKPDPDPQPTTTIMDLQGDGWASPFTDPKNGQFVSDQAFTVSGVITAIQTQALDGDLPVGFFIQDEKGDDNPKTSDGIFVKADVTGLVVGDKVSVTGPVEEHYGWTQIPATAVEKSGTSSIMPTKLTRLSSDKEFDFTLERHEGMLVTLDSASNLSVSRSYGFDTGPKRNNMVLSHGGADAHPNQHFLPGSDQAARHADCIDDERLIVESFEKVTQGKPSWYPDFGQTDTDQDGSSDDYIRVQDKVNGLQGVLSYSYSDYRFYVTQPATRDQFIASESPRSATPDLTREGDVVMATLNTGGYFNSLQGSGANSPYLGDTIPGAQSPQALALQTDKLVATIIAMDADVLGLMGIENNGFGDSSAIVALITRVNAELPEAKQYHIASQNGLEYIGQLEYSNQVIYRPSTVGLVSLETLPLPQQRVTDQDSVTQADVLLPTFSFKDREETLTVAVSDFVSREASCTSDDNDMDRQAGCDQLRVTAADYLGQHLATLAGEKVILGSLNAFAKESALQVLTQNSTDVTATTAANTWVGEKAWHAESQTVETSYGFENALAVLQPKAFNALTGDQHGSLDYILTSQGLKSKVIGATQWNINAAESSLFGHDHSEALGQEYRDVYRVAMHDPVLISISFKGKPLDPVDPFAPYDPDQPIAEGTPVALPLEPVNEPRDAYQTKTPVAGQSFTYFVDLTANGGYLNVGDEVTVSVTNANQAFVATASNVAKKKLDAYEIALGWTQVTVPQGLSAGDYQVKTAVADQVLNSQSLTVTAKAKDDASSVGIAGLLALLGFGALRRRKA